MVRAIAWTGAAKWATQLLTWAATIMVARMLAPADYGIFGMATLYLGLVALISEFGLGQAVVVLREMSDDHTAQINTLSVAFGFVLFLVSCALALPLARFFHTTKLAAVIMVMSLSFVISSAQVVPDALLQRGLRFRLLASFDTIRAFTQAPTTIILAYLGFGYWSLALGSLAGVAVYAALTVFACPSAFAVPRLGEIRRALGFSTDVLGSRIAWYVYSNSDFLIAGRLLGQAALGTYTIAWTIASTPVEKITNMVTRVTPAFFSAVQHDNSELRRYLLRLTEGLSLITFPASFGIVLVADQFVGCVLGPKWRSAAVPLQLLGVYAAFRSITTLFPGILYATRHSRFVMWNTVVAAVVFPVAFYLTSRSGINGIAATWILLYPLITAPFMWRTFRAIELPIQTYFRSLIPAIRATLIMILVVIAVRIISPLSWSLPARFAASMLTGTVTYLLVLLSFDRERLHSFSSLIRSKS
jgi:PST family polysaccharide transporter